MEAVLAQGVTTMPSTIWLDDSGRIVQTRTTVTVDGVSSDTLFKVTALQHPGRHQGTRPTADVYTG